mgnify:CR=1 FL=1
MPVNNFFNTKDVLLNRFFDRFQADAKQREEIEELIQSIILKRMLGKTVVLYGRTETIEAFKSIKSINQENPGSSKFIVAAFTALELSYYDLIEEVLHSLLSLDEVTDLQQYLEKH